MPGYILVNLWLHGHCRIVNDLKIQSGDHNMRAPFARSDQDVSFNFQIELKGRDRLRSFHRATAISHEEMLQRVSDDDA